MLNRFGENETEDFCGDAAGSMWDKRAVKLNLSSDRFFQLGVQVQEPLLEPHNGLLSIRELLG